MAGEGAPRQVGDGVSRPEKISGAPPAYTEIARKSEIQGIAIVEAIIDERGNVTNPRILQGLPLGLDQDALEAVKTWKFKPSMFEGRPTRAETIELGLQAEDRAMAAKPGYIAPILYKVKLLMEKVKSSSNWKEQATLTIEVQELQDRAKKLYAETMDPFSATDETASADPTAQDVGRLF
jgi:TonB family protein